MLDREQYKKNLDEDLYDEVQELHPLYKEVQSLDGSTMYFNTYGGFLVKVCLIIYKFDLFSFELV